MHLPMPHRTGRAKTGTIHRNALGLNEAGQHFREALVLGRLVYLLDYTLQPMALQLESSYPDIRSADVACQNHKGIFLQCRPSRAINSSDSFGPQLPAA